MKADTGYSVYSQLVCSSKDTYTGEQEKTGTGSAERREVRARPFGRPEDRLQKQEEPRLPVGAETER